MSASWQGLRAVRGHTVPVGSGTECISVTVRLPCALVQQRAQASANFLRESSQQRADERGGECGPALGEESGCTEKGTRWDSNWSLSLSRALCALWFIARTPYSVAPLSCAEPVRPAVRMTGSQTLLPYFAVQFNKMGSFKRPRPRFMSSPALSDLPRFYAGRQPLQLNSSAMWNSVQTAVINVFRGGGLQVNELYTLNENIRHLLKSDLGPFITDYFQNQLLAKGLTYMEEKVKLYEGENRIAILSELWDHFFTEILPTLQAIFYPVQGQELTIRQIALLGFRDSVVLKVNLGKALSMASSQLPPSILQMLLVLQSVHEPLGPNESYLRLEELVKMVVSPYVGAYGDRHCSNMAASGIHESRMSRSHPRAEAMPYSPHATSSLASQRSLSPLTEQEGEAYLEKCGSIRRHTVANAHTDIQLLAMTSIMHPGRSEEAELDEQCLLLQPTFTQRQCSSEPNIAEAPAELLGASPEQISEQTCPATS
ncbi:proline-rich protein 5-like isoform X1 [Xenopus tropicalis]|nr:proline-rich protein 5-like isoform X1 [Xenopus tropicalis]